MNKCLLFLLAVLPLFLTGKETKKIIRHSFYPMYKETYYVLKSDTAVRHGSYKAETADQLLIEGHYTMGYMDSIWTQYNLQGKIRSRGWYEKSRRDSIWEYYDRKGELEQKIDFTNDQVLLYKTTFANHIFKIYTGGDSLMTKLERPPLFIGGSSWFSDFVGEELCIPLHKEKEKVIGPVFVAFTIDSLGVASNFRVLKGIGKICNNEALRVIKSIPHDWIPGVYNGNFVSVEYVVIVVFDASTSSMDF